MKVMNKVTLQQFYFTVVYAFNGIQERESLWLKLQAISNKQQGPWAIGGDFNCVLQANERLGGSFNSAAADPFHNCLDVCQVMDIQASRAFFTWNNKQPPETRIYSRMDRFFVNQEWFLPEGHFDHNPCIVRLGNNDQKANRPFKYFNMWSSSPKFHDIVKATWTQPIYGTNMYRVVRKMKLLKPELKQLNRSQFSDIENKIDLTPTRLYHIQQQLILQPGNVALIQQELEVRKMSQELQEAKVAFLRQKAKAHWLTEADLNTIIFMV
ncbi:uncharacterized protein LOC141629791 [Silene latifolia]|uniref:uncharacterized protein LOC141629791 n=1 Tax=Silene latifolia TaxID=37657 RepID=UPI003D779661